jgi:Protein of unknown function (DUF1329)
MKRRDLRVPFGSLFCLALLSVAGVALAQTKIVNGTATTAAATHPSAIDENNSSQAGSADSIADGTTITIQNWQQYRRFLPDGMAALFEGKYAWKMPRDVAMEVGPTIIHPLPKSYMQATEMHSSQVKVVELPDGGLNLTGYQGGIPFPNPSEPHKGWKILANVWFRYLPHVGVDKDGRGCEINGYGNVSCNVGLMVYRQLSYNTDPGVPVTIPGAEDKFFTQYFETIEPEESRYTASLKISYTDLTRPESVYVFIPSLRRAQPLSSTSRCTTDGTDVTPDDSRAGFESNLTEAKVEFVGEKKILALLGFNSPKDKFPADFDLPLGWPRPSWGKWQLRDVYVLSVSKVPAHAAGYCYGKRTMYVDKQFNAPLWEDLYDNQMRLWKVMALFLPTVEAQVGTINSSLAHVHVTWDLYKQHATFFLHPADGHQFYVNEQVPASFLDLTRYTEPGGLNLIMR